MTRRFLLSFYLKVRAGIVCVSFSRRKQFFLSLSSYVVVVIRRHRPRYKYSRRLVWNGDALSVQVHATLFGLRILPGIRLHRSVGIRNIDSQTSTR